MKQFTLELRENDQRPIVIIQRPKLLYAMLDTGAIFPVWTAAEKLLQESGGELAEKDKPFGGFGGMTKGHLYHIKNFCVGEMIFPIFPVIASPRDLPCQLLMSATMFSNLIYEIDDKNHRFNVTIPETESYIRTLKIKEENGRLHVFCTSA